MNYLLYMDYLIFTMGYLTFNTLPFTYLLIYFTKKKYK